MPGFNREEILKQTPAASVDVAGDSCYSGEDVSRDGSSIKLAISVL
jgi:hypothetical protein